MITKYYPLAKKMLNASPIPLDILNNKLYKGNKDFAEDCDIMAKRTNYTANIVDSIVDWDLVREEINGKRVKSISEGKCIYGNNSGAKNSTDHNYLRYAQDSKIVLNPIKILPLHEVTEIYESVVTPGGFTLAINILHPDGKVVHGQAQKVIIETISMECDLLILSAGSLGTSKLLTKCKSKDWLPELNSYVGKGWGTNGDHIEVRTLEIETQGATSGSPTYKKLSDPDNAVGPISLLYCPAIFPFELLTSTILGLAIVPNKGYFTYDEHHDKTTLTWNKDWSRVQDRELDKMLDNVCETTLFHGGGGGLRLTISPLTNTTFHPLGGMCLGQATDDEGRVIGYDNMYVVDGSLLYGSSGNCNPSISITAVAEYVMEKIKNKYGLSSFQE
jgi:cholesterol oxidase